MKVQVTAKFFLDNGEVKRVDWFEIDPKLIGKIVENGVDKPIEIILKSAKDVQDEYKKIFRRLHRQGEMFIVENINGELAGVPFTKVTYWTLKAREVTKNVTESTNRASV
ncbi:hypothetical protein [Paenibacillus amylolyticus]|uniref:Uncharacterized protein n=1 Tax=Paenibacillus amylolyticus TaxID=1451 RepID=A0A124DXS4_PAEAM|nr:hypothetical protein [Paenibacillus amylolyticus]GAS81990.1 unknown protein [Paenibacillus amylolyticus]